MLLISDEALTVSPLDDCQRWSILATHLGPKEKQGIIKWVGRNLRKDLMKAGIS